MSFPSSVRSIEIEQQVCRGFDLEFCKRLVERCSAIEHYAFICHDSDTKPDGSAVAPHVHLLCRFRSPYPVAALLKHLEGVAGVQNLEKVKSWKSAVAYLTHENKPEKHRYERTAVFSNYDFAADIDSCLSSINTLPRLLEKIASGEVKRYNIHEYCDVSTYSNNRNKIEFAFEFRDKMNFMEVNRNMEVIYIYGDPGAGKTTMAKKIAADRGFSLFVSSGGKDFLDGYNGQECIILDDFRGSSAPLSVVLKLLDNHTASSVPSRYKNKSISECRLVILTTVKPPRSLFNDVFESESEPFAQFSRRCTSLIRMSRQSLDLYCWDESVGDFYHFGTLPNTVLEDFKKIDREDCKRRALECLGRFGDFVKRNADFALDNLPSDGSPSVGSSGSVAEDGSLFPY